MSAIRRSSGANRSSGELNDGAWTPIVAACAALLTRRRPFAGKKARGQASDRCGRCSLWTVKGPYADIAGRRIVRNNQVGSRHGRRRTRLHAARRIRAALRAGREAAHAAGARGGARGDDDRAPRGPQAARAAGPGRGPPRRRHARGRLARERRTRRDRARAVRRRRAGPGDAGGRDGGPPADAGRVGPAGGRAPRRAPGRAARGAGRAARGRARHGGCAGARLGLLPRARRGRAQRRAAARHELDPRHLPPARRAVPGLGDGRRRTRPALRARGAGDRPPPAGSRERRGPRAGRAPGESADGVAAVTLRALTPREASIFACVCDAVVAPEPVLPPVRDTDAVAFFDGWMARSPALNRIGMRALLYAFELSPFATGERRRLRRLDGARRAAWLHAIERVPSGQV